MLYDFIALHHHEIMRRAKVGTPPNPSSTDATPTHGVRIFLEQLIDALQSGTVRKAEISQSASQYGHDLFRLGGHFQFGASRLQGLGSQTGANPIADTTPTRSAEWECGMKSGSSLGNCDSAFRISSALQV